MIDTMKPEIISRVMDMVTGETMGKYPVEYRTEWAKWRETGEKSEKLLELEERYRVRQYTVTYELIEEEVEKDKPMVKSKKKVTKKRRNLSH